MNTSRPAIRQLLLVMIAACHTSRAFAQDMSKGAPPEIRQTVNRLLGHWNFQGTDTEPNAKPSRVALTIDCRPTALGAAVVCDLKGGVADSGPVEATAVVGYSPDEHVVRWMEISSSGEYHDHRGNWKGNALEFEPLSYTVLGKKYTEKFSLSFPASGDLQLKAVTESADGPSIIAGTATRR